MNQKATKGSQSYNADMHVSYKHTANANKKIHFSYTHVHIYIGHKFIVS